ncbi:twin-arginine translocase TatA/TatE family subunit [Candidatus Omnitrophota bacterium]
MFGLGLPELIIILGVILLLFGASRLPGIGKALGKSISEFKKGMGDKDESNDTKKTS